MEQAGSPSEVQALTGEQPGTAWRLGGSTLCTAEQEACRACNAQDAMKYSTPSSTMPGQSKHCLEVGCVASSPLHDSEDCHPGQSCCCGAAWCCPLLLLQPPAYRCRRTSRLDENGVRSLQCAACERCLRLDKCVQGRGQRTLACACTYLVPTLMIQPLYICGV